MNVKDARVEYHYFSGKVSEIARQLCLASIALVWIFKTDVGGRQQVPGELLPATLLAVGGLASDFLQYLYGSLAWGYFQRKKELEVRRAEPSIDSFHAPRWINWPTLTFFWLKLILTAATYTLLFSYLLRRVF